jgi:uncharacterized protein YutE (UPF0331/DUF86 family)
MSISEKRKLMAAQLRENLADLDKASEAMAYSHHKCQTIGEKADYDLEEQETFEALTARFARTSDIFTLKALKTVFFLLQENPRTNIDAAHLAEKLGIVDNVDILLNLRELRNQIAHEYVRTQLAQLFMDVMHYVPELHAVIDNLKTYCKKTKF